MALKFKKTILLNKFVAKLNDGLVFILQFLFS